MKKQLKSVVNYNGRPARITATVTDVNGYISITADLIPYRCKTVHACGCLHDEISKAFPKLRPFLWLHLVNVDGSTTFEDDGRQVYENTLNKMNLRARRLQAIKDFYGVLSSL